MNERENIRSFLNIIIHVVMWGFVFFFPYLMMTRGGSNVSFTDYVWATFPYYVIYIAYFYLNNNLLIPRLLLKRKFWLYVLQLLVLTGVASFLSGWLHQIEFERMMMSWRDSVPFEFRGYMPPNQEMRFWSVGMIMGRDFFIMALVATITAVVRVIEAWNDLESSKREAEKQDRRNRYYGSEGSTKRYKRRPHIYLFRPDELDNDDVISAVEQTPTYKRTREILDSIYSQANGDSPQQQNEAPQEPIQGTIVFS